MMRNRLGFVGLEILVLVVLISGLITGVATIVQKDTFNIAKKASYTCNGYCAPRGEGCGGDTCGNGGSCATNSICCKACSAPTPAPTPVSYTCNGTCFPNGEDCYQRGGGTCASGRFCCQTATAPPTPTPTPTARPTPTPIPTPTPVSYSCNGSCFPNGEDCYTRGNGTCATGRFCCLTAIAPPAPTPTPTARPTPTPTPTPVSYSCNGSCFPNGEDCYRQGSGSCATGRFCCLTAIAPPAPTPTPTPITTTSRCWDDSYAPDGDATNCPKKPTPAPTPTPTTLIAKSNGLGCTDSSQCSTKYCEGGGYSEGQVSNGICKEKPKPIIINPGLDLAAITNSEPNLDFKKNDEACKGKTKGSVCYVGGQVGECRGASSLTCEVIPILNPTMWGQTISDAGARTNDVAEKLVANVVASMVNQFVTNSLVFGELASKQNQSATEKLTQFYALGDIVTIGGVSSTTNAAINWRDKCWNSSSPNPECTLASVGAGIAGTAAAAGLTSPWINPTTVAGKPISSIYNSIQDTVIQGTTFGSEAFSVSGGGTYTSMQGQKLIIDPSKDPLLKAFAEDSQKAIAIKKPDVTVSEALNEYTNKSLRYAYPDRLNSGPTLLRNDLYSSGKPVNLGEFIENRTGVCREFAACMHVSLAEAGQENSMVVGKIERLSIPGQEDSAGTAYHAWVEYFDNASNQWMVADPTNNFVVPRDIAYADYYGSATDISRKVFVKPGGTSLMDKLKEAVNLTIANNDAGVVSIPSPASRLDQLGSLDQVRQYIEDSKILIGADGSKMPSANLLRFVDRIVSGETSLEVISSRFPDLYKTLKRLGYK